MYFHKSKTLPLIKKHFHQSQKHFHQYKTLAGMETLGTRPNKWACSQASTGDKTLAQITKDSCKLRVDAGGEDWRHWKNLLENRFTKETTCLPFSMSDFPQFITTIICCVKQKKQELISWAHSSLLIFKDLDWITLRSESRWFSIEICVVLLLTAWTVYNKSYCNKTN